MKKVIVSAPGKLMLLGEHSVVYNRPCIVTAVGQRMFITAQVTERDTFELDTPDVDVKGYKKPISDLGKGDIPKGAKFTEVAVKNFLEKYPFKGGLQIKTKSQFSSQFGFGSSSASTVCIIKALSQLTKKKLNNVELFDLSYKTVLDIQGKGSGFDVAAAIYGGTLYFVTGGKVIEPLKVKELPLIIGYTGVKADTVTLINQVKEKAKKYPNAVENIYSSITELVKMAKLAIKKKHWINLAELMNLNQGYLYALGVSSRILEDLIFASLEAGAYGAKLSGAGVGDCMIAIADPKLKTKIGKAINQAGGKFIKIDVNVEGVTVEK